MRKPDDLFKPSSYAVTYHRVANATADREADTGRPHAGCTGDLQDDVSPTKALAPTLYAQECPAIAKAWELAETHCAAGMS